MKKKIKKVLFIILGIAAVALIFGVLIFGEIYSGDDAEEPNMFGQLSVGESFGEVQVYPDQIRPVVVL